MSEEEQVNKARENKLNKNMATIKALILHQGVLHMSQLQIHGAKQFQLDPDHR